jgi:hypothetical protein
MFPTWKSRGGRAWCGRCISAMSVDPLTSDGRCCVAKVGGSVPITAVSRCHKYRAQKVFADSIRVSTATSAQPLLVSRPSGASTASKCVCRP